MKWQKYQVCIISLNEKVYLMPEFTQIYAHLQILNFIRKNDNLHSKKTSKHFKFLLKIIQGWIQRGKGGYFSLLKKF